MKTNCKTIITALCLVAVPFFSASAQDTSQNIVGVGPVDTTIFARVEVEASFPGGLAGWQNFLFTHLKANTPIRRKAPAGTYTVTVQFIVDRQGELSDVKALTAHGYGMEEEVMRVVRKSPRWLPALQNGRKVKAYRRQPVTFVVSDK